MRAFAEFVRDAVFTIGCAGIEHWQFYGPGTEGGTFIDLRLNTAGRLVADVTAGHILCGSSCDPVRFGFFLESRERDLAEVT